MPVLASRFRGDTEGWNSILEASSFVVHDLHTSVSSSLPASVDFHSIASDVVAREFGSSELLASNRAFSLQWLAAACSALSVIATFAAFYWFCRMQKRFRHRLIMLLLYGDLIRSLWFFIFAVISIKSHTVSSESLFCQISGTLIQYGTETTDYAVLSIAIHSALQVFRPACLERSDGLHRYRHYIYAGAFIIPALMSALAFINPDDAYISQGVLCALPLRPYWYRLALAWIPRYLIALIIIGLAMAIYAHAGFEFRSVSQASQNTNGLMADSVISSAYVETGAGTSGASSLQPSKKQMKGRAESDCQPLASPQSPVSDRRVSVVASSSDMHPSDGCSTGSHKIKAPSFPPGDLPEQPQMSGVNDVNGRAGDVSHGKQCRSRLPSDQPSRRNLSIGQQISRLRGDDRSKTNDTSKGTPNRMVRQRARIHRQLRLMFVYPLVYICLWIFPFVIHCMQYNDYWVENPPYIPIMIAAISYTMMGFVDCLIFSLREKPWRHIPSTNTTGATFLSSFCCHLAPETVGTNHDNEDAGRLSERDTADAVPAARKSIAKFRGSGITDRQRDAAAAAYERLKFEQDDRRKASRTKERVSLEQDGAGPEAGRSQISTLESLESIRNDQFSADIEKWPGPESEGVKEKGKDSEGQNRQYDTAVDSVGS